jgi:hypothetical protein
MPTSENYWVIKNILMAGSYPLRNTKSNNSKKRYQLFKKIKKYHRN